MSDPTYKKVKYSPASSNETIAWNENGMFYFNKKHQYNFFNI